MKQKSIKFLNALVVPILVGAIGGYSAIFFRELIKIKYPAASGRGIRKTIVGDLYAVYDTPFLGC